MGKVNKKILTGIIIGLVLSLSGLAVFLGVWFRPVKIIEIFDDKDFSQKYHFPGKGTEENPYLIDGYKLSGNEYHNIKIYDVTKYFIIQNCILSNSNKGIDLRGLEYGIAKIINNTISDNDYGIIIRTSPNCLIFGNNFQNNNRGIEAYSTSDLTIKANTFNDCIQDGMFLEDLYNIEVQGNNFNSCADGFTILNSNEVIIERNTVINSKEVGIRAQYITNIVIVNNSVTNSSLGFAIAYSKNTEISKNNFTKNNNGLLLSITDSGLVSQNYFFKNNYYGIFVYGLSNSVIMNNNINTNYGDGLRMEVCYATEIYNNTCYNNTVGMAIHYSRIPKICYNIFEHNLEYGLVALGTNGTIWNNNFIENNYMNITTIHAQAKGGNCTYDDTFYVGLPNWFNETSNTGNYWSELIWYTGVEYTIDPGNYKDNYPLEEPIIINL
ncbi:MAG TPA: right-handed parallel beta-helix repeat-containing protein [Candidatus Bathyarchaeia archaeon]|nr:right-handed parallel beta-helix repeat-containing protein [Candidatus Bathyarchaeia archaeon]